MKIFYLWNLGFFGGWREGRLSVDGQIRIYMDGCKFQVEKIGGYEGLTWYPEMSVFPELADNNYRYIHDTIKNTLRGGRANIQDVNVPFRADVPVYTLQDAFISRNIQVGDTVEDLFTDEKRLVEYGDDLKYYNSHKNFKIISREVEHPAKMSRSEFLEKLKAKNPFDEWKQVEKMPKNIDRLFTLRADSAIFDCRVLYTNGADTYFVKSGDKIYSKCSSISAPFYDAVDLLSGLVFVEYSNGNRIEHCIYDVKRDGDRFYHSKIFNEEGSYHYNNARIKRNLK